MIKKYTFAIILSLGALLASANAQTPIAPEKLAALKELSALVSADNKVEDITKLFSAEMEGMRKQIVKSIIEAETEMSAAEKLELEKALLSDKGSKYKNYEERLLQKLDAGKMMDDMLISIYDKVFTLAEIKDMLAFYKTPTGSKMLKQTPVIMAESMKIMQEKLVPKILDALREIEQEDRRAIEAEINARKPQAKRQVG
jgi:hypothetical protein